MDVLPQAPQKFALLKTVILLSYYVKGINTFVKDKNWYIPRDEIMKNMNVLYVE